MALTEITTKSIKDGEIVNADINASADIAGSKIADNAITLAKMAGGTDGHIITYDASGDPITVGPGNDGQVLTSTGAGSPPAFEDITSSPITALNNATQNELVTVGSTTTELDAEANLQFDGTAFRIGPSAKTSHPTLNDIFLGGASHMYAEITAAAGNTFSVSQNAHVASDGGWKYVVTDEASNIYQNAGAIGFRTAASGTADSAITWAERLTVANTGDVTIGDGNLVIGGTGHGIDFSNSQTSSSETGATTGSEVLDHYEEGTFTATASASGYTGAACVDEHYTRIGNVVHVCFRLNVTSNLSDADLTISGLPFSNSGSAGYCSMQWQDGAGFTIGGGRISGTSVERFGMISAPNSSGNVNFYFQGTYRT